LKFTKRAPKTPEIAGKAVYTTGTVAAGLLHAPPWLVVRGFTRRHWQCPEMGGSAMLSSSLPFFAGCKNHCYLQRGKKHNAKLPILSFFHIYSLLSSLSSFLFFPSSGGRSTGFFSPPPLHRRWPFFRSLSSPFSPSLDPFDFWWWQIWRLEEGAVGVGCCQGRCAEDEEEHGLSWLVCGRCCWGNWRGSRRCWWGRKCYCWRFGVRWRSVRERRVAAGFCGGRMGRLLWEGEAGLCAAKSEGKRWPGLKV